MQRALFVVILACILIGLPLLVLGDTAIPRNEATSSMSEAGNSSASATMTITMTGVLDD